jgi:signal transduction histidine kinase
MRWPSVGLLGRIFVILLVVLATEFAASTFLFERANHFALQDDDARRMAEHLVVARRVLDRTEVRNRAGVTDEVSTDGFTIAWARKGVSSKVSYELDGLRSQMIEMQPELLAAKLRLHLQPLHSGSAITGTMDLSDGTLLKFHTIQAHAAWSVTLGWLLALFAPPLALVIVGGLMIRTTLKPLTTLIRATKHVGTDGHEQVPERGSSEVRSLIHAFNEMHARIHRLIMNRTQALVAVGHDLRTPLARLHLRLDNADIDGETRHAMEQDIDELRSLLQSLQDYLSGEGGGQPQQRLDLAAMAMTIVDNARDEGKDAYYIGPSSVDVIARPVAMRRAIANLVDNALHYGGNVRVILQAMDTEVMLSVEDDGPGIPDDQLVEVLQPFIRLDGARARNTSGMGLGLAIVSNAVRAEQGVLKLERHAGGGLRATITLPLRKD